MHQIRSSSGKMAGRSNDQKKKRGASDGAAVGWLREYLHFKISENHFKIWPAKQSDASDQKSASEVKRSEEEELHLTEEQQEKAAAVHQTPAFPENSCQPTF